MSDINLPAEPVLLFAYGNPSRGDDALGPMLLQQIETLIDHKKVALLTDFQLQIEHALDLQNRQRILFIDCSETAKPPWQFAAIEADPLFTYSTHAISPQAVLSVYQQMYHQPPPPTYLLGIRGYQFELGQSLSEKASQHLQSAVAFVLSWIEGK